MKLKEEGKIILVVFLGGITGGLLRLIFLNTIFINNQLLSITIINLLGTFILAFVSEFDFNNYWQSFLKTGVLGAFTSFSTIMILFNTEKNLLKTILFLIISIFGGILMTKVARKIHGKVYA
ncbi:MAG: CrcB family protein [Lactobacillaceae bacterium]|jgi:CrcB protein|nr:CrcB family protein [Lactobacillaceae bacterium]